MKKGDKVKMEIDTQLELGLPEGVVYTVADILTELDVEHPIVLRVTDNPWNSFFGDDWMEFVSEWEIYINND